MPLDGQDGRSGQIPDPGEIDERLVALAGSGDRAAFDELYRRHAPLARRVAWSVLHDDRDADDVVADAFERLLRVIPTDRLHDRRAFRAYLLVTTRNRALDVVRRRRPADGWDEALEALTAADALDDTADEEAGYVRRAFARLPERWRAVLWLTEVEAMPHRAAADLLGVSANAVAQLAARARAGLRESFLQAHVEGPAPEPCRFTRERLAAYAGGGLGPAEAAEVERHLAGCEACRDRCAEVVDLAGTLRRVGVPLGLVLGGGTLAGRGLAGGVRLHLGLIARRALLGVGAVAATAGLVVGVGVLTRDPAPAVIPAPVAVTTVVTRPPTAAPPPTVASTTTVAPTTSVAPTTTEAPTTTARPTTTVVPPRATSTTVRLPAVRATVPTTPAGRDDERRCDRPSRHRCRRAGR